MGRSIYRAMRRKGVRKEGEDLSDYIMPGPKTIEVSRLYRARGRGEGADRGPSDIHAS